jgi:serine/threonine protein kinase
VSYGVRRRVNKLVVIKDSDEEIGPYRLLGLLGRGGMAEVWKAEHRHLGQIRALKVLLPAIAARADLVARLVTEARATAWLRHPVIVEVFDCDVLADGTAFIAMEYLQGEQLRAWLARVGNLAHHPRLAAAIVGRAAEGLAFAHNLGVVHRDLKPENLFLVPLESDRPAFAVKLLDFGIAKLLCEQSPARTRPGCVIGTPDYMAPEQWQLGQPVDHRSDVYALGCVMFELLAGRPPFQCSDEVGVMRAHLEETPPALASLEPGVPAALSALVQGMLAKQPEARPQTMAAVIVALEAFLGLERPRFAELLRAPADLAVWNSDASVPLATKRGLNDEPRPVRAGPFLPTVAAPGTVRVRRRRHVALTASLAVTVAAAGVTALWLGRDGIAGPPEAVVASPPPVPASPAPAPAVPPPAAPAVPSVAAPVSPPIAAPVAVPPARATTVAGAQARHRHRDGDRDRDRARQPPAEPARPAPRATPRYQAVGD